MKTDTWRQKQDRPDSFVIVASRGCSLLTALSSLRSTALQICLFCVGAAPQAVYQGSGAAVGELWDGLKFGGS